MTQQNTGVMCPFENENILNISTLLTASHQNFLLFFPSVYLYSDVFKSPTEVPKFEWLNKYQRSAKSQGVVQQALSPLGTARTRLNQQKKTGL